MSAILHSSWSGDLNFFADTGLPQILTMTCLCSQTAPAVVYNAAGICLLASCALTCTCALTCSGLAHCFVQCIKPRPCMLVNSG